MIENTIRTEQGQIRIMRDALESRYGRRISGKHHAMPWLIRHATAVHNRYHKGSDGRTRYERLRGRPFNKEVAEFGECIWYLKPKSKGKEKRRSRWDNGIWLGIRDESNEIFVGTPQGVLKVRTIRRRADKEGRWNWEQFEAMRGVPWEPIPGREGIEVKASIYMPGDTGPIQEGPLT